MCGWLGRVSEFLGKMCFRDESTQNGGAYIFRPTSDQSFEVVRPGSVVVYESDLVTDASGIAQHHDAVAGTSKQRKSALYFDTPILLNQYRH